MSVLCMFVSSLLYDVFLVLSLWCSVCEVMYRILVIVLMFGNCLGVCVSFWYMCCVMLVWLCILLSRFV